MITRPEIRAVIVARSETCHFSWSMFSQSEMMMLKLDNQVHLKLLRRK